MIKRNDEIQMGLVAYLKSKPAIFHLLYNEDKEEIKEWFWQGTDAHYPCVRVRIISNIPFAHCNFSEYNAGIMVFSEDASSYEANYIAGIIANNLHGKGFTSSGTAYTANVTNLVPAIRQDERTWRAEILINGTAM